MQQEHTPTPYMVEPINDGKTYQLTTCEDAGFVVVAETPTDLINSRQQADFMALACNAHDALVVALKRAERDLAKFQYPDPVFPSNEWVSQTRRISLAALAKPKIQS